MYNVHVKPFKRLHTESESKYYIGNDYNYDQFKMTFAAVHSHFDFSGKVKENLIRTITPLTESLTTHIHMTPFILYYIHCRRKTCTCTN